MIIAYLRVSSDSQSTDMQECELTKWFDSAGIALDQVTWFRDTISGNEWSRDGLDKIRELVAKNKVKTLVIWKFDRLSRKLKDGILLLHEVLDSGARLVVTTMDIDLSGPIGKIIAALLFGLAEIENSHRRERQMAGIELAKQNGVFKGRKKGTFKASQKRAWELRQKNISYKNISQILGVSEGTAAMYVKTVQKQREAEMSNA